MLNNSGFFFGMAMIVFMGFIFFVSIMTLVEASIVSNCNTLQGMVSFLFGKVNPIYL